MWFQNSWKQGDMTKALHFVWKWARPGESCCHAEYKWERKPTSPSLPLKSCFPLITILFPYINSYSIEILYRNTYFFLFGSLLQKYTQLRMKKKLQTMFRDTNKAPALREPHVPSAQRPPACSLSARSFLPVLHSLFPGCFSLSPFLV